MTRLLLFAGALGAFVLLLAVAYAVFHRDLQRRFLERHGAADVSLALVPWPQLLPFALRFLFVHHVWLQALGIALTYLRGKDPLDQLSLTELDALYRAFPGRWKP